MPLSEHEQQQLDALEKELYREDPRFVQHISAPRELNDSSLNAKNFVLGVLVLVAGVVIAACGLVFLSGHQPFNIIVGVCGFAVMVFGGYLAVSGRGRKAKGSADEQSASKSKSAKSSGGFMDRMEERWERRQEN